MAMCCVCTLALAEPATLPVRLPGARIPESLLRESRRVAGEGERWLEKRGEVVGDEWGGALKRWDTLEDRTRRRVAVYLKWLAQQDFFDDMPKTYPMCVWGWATQLLDALPPSLLAEVGIPTGWRALIANQILSRQRSDGGWEDAGGAGTQKGDGDVSETQWAVWTLRRITEE